MKVELYYHWRQYDWEEEGQFAVDTCDRSEYSADHILLKVVEVETSEVIETRTIEANSESSSISLAGSFMGFGGRTNSNEKTPVGKAIRACVINIADYLTCSMVDKTPECLAKYAAKDEKRREKTRDSIKLDE